MTTPLFRREAIDQRHGHRMGSVRIGHNVRYSAIAVFALVFAGVLAAYATLGSYTRKARLQGHLVPVHGSLDITSPQPGVVLAVRVREGEQVEAGQALAVVGTDRTTAQGRTVALLQSDLARRQGALAAERRLIEERAGLRLLALQERARHLRAEVDQLAAEGRLLDRRVALSNETLARFRELAAQGYVSVLQAQQKEDELLELRARAESLRRSAAASHRERRAVEADIEGVHADLRLQHAQVDGQQARLSQEATENLARGEVVVTAAQRGTVTALHVHAGQSIDASGAVATLVPHAPGGEASALVAQLYASTKAVGFVREGQTVLVRYGAYPFQKFGMAQGQVASVSQTPIDARALSSGAVGAAMAAAPSAGPVYRITVALDKQSIDTYGVSRPLRPGMALEADIVQDRRAIWEWALEPVLAVGV